MVEHVTQEMAFVNALKILKEMIAAVLNASTTVILMEAAKMGNACATQASVENHAQSHYVKTTVIITEYAHKVNVSVLMVSMVRIAQKKF